MKKIFTLLFAVGMITMVQAQPGTRDNRQNDERDRQDNDQGSWKQNDQRNDQRGYDDGYGKVVNNVRNPYDRDFPVRNKFAAERQLKLEIAQINYEYDHKIDHVRDNFFLFRFEKQQQIRNLEFQRQREIDKVIAQFNRRYGFNDRHDHGYGYNNGRGSGGRF